MSCNSGSYLSLLWSMVITSIGPLTCKKCELWDTRDGSLVYSNFCSCRKPRFVSQNPRGALSISINSNSRKSDTLFWPPRAPAIYMVCKHMCKPTLIRIKIIAKNFKRRNTDSWAPHGMPTATLFYKTFYGGSQTWSSYEPQPTLNSWLSAFWQKNKYFKLLKSVTVFPWHFPQVRVENTSWWQMQVFCLFFQEPCALLSIACPCSEHLGLSGLNQEQHVRETWRVRLLASLVWVVF